MCKANYILLFAIFHYFKRKKNWVKKTNIKLKNIVSKMAAIDDKTLAWVAIKEAVPD